MKKTYKIFGLVMLTGLILNIFLWLGNTTSAQEPGQIQGPELERREPAERMEMMRNRLAELRENARNAEREGRPEEARELREQATRLAQQVQMQARRAEQRRLRQIDEYLNRLRQMTREAEEMRERIRLQIEQPEIDRPGPRPERELPFRLEPLRPRVQRRIDNVHNVIGQIRETFMGHLERVEETFGGLRNNMEQMEQEIQELRAENERLRNQLRERDELRRPRDRDVPERRDIERPREGRERDERPPVERQ